jgi:glycosyltransferase involved in cell wall biosynthesis
MLVSTNTGSSPDRRPSICFVALNAYNVLSGRKDVNHTGGAEVQQLQIASWLRQRGYPVRFVTLDHGQGDSIEIDGIKVFRAYAKTDGIRGLRFVHPRWSGLWAAMARANADVYYQRGAECETGQVGLWCRFHRRRFIFAAANDSDCDASLYALPSRAERWLYRLGLRLADAVTAQTTTQQDRLRKNLGAEAVVIRNCGRTSADPARRERPGVGAGEPLQVLWVGRISRQKRLEWLLDAAQKCPEVAFDVVGAPNEDSPYSSSVIERAAGVRNVRIRGRVPYAEMAQYYQRCHVLCCTSAYEGFPNTFLEAWNLGIPVISTFDPDGAIAAHGLGWVAQDVEGIISCLREVIRSPESWNRASQAARQYYLANHTPEACLPALEQLLLRVTGCETHRVE